MSEQALRAAPSGNGSVTGTATTGTYPTLTAGNVRSDAGKDLPTVAAVEPPDIESLVKELNTVSRNIGRDLRFDVDLEQGRAVLQVFDRETGELIRQIPPDKAKIAMNANGTVSMRLFDAVI